MTHLRGYQQRALDAVYNDLTINQNVLLQGMMGCGKTCMAVTLIQRLFRENPGMKFLILMHKQELCNQFFDAFQKFTDIPFHKVGICCASIGKTIIDRDITIASIQTFVNMMEKYSGAGLIIIDEAHRIDINGNTQYKQVIDYLRLQRPNSRLFGITATPARLGHGFIYGKKCKPGAVNLFSELSYQITYKELLNEGFLVPLKGIVAAHESMEEDLAGISVNGDYVINQLGEIMTTERHLDTCVEAIDKYCQGYKRICVFCCTIAHAEKIKELLGSRATIVHSQLSAIDRHNNMTAWVAGDIPIMTSVNILTEGFDLPVLDCLVFARPTLSSTLFLQAVGRVLRTHNGKDHGLLIDLTDNCHRFGTDLDKVKVTVPKSVEAAEKAERSMWKLCPQCEIEVHIALRECPDCGFAWPETECVVANALPPMKEVDFTKQSSIVSSPPIECEVTDFYIEIHNTKSSGKRIGKIAYNFKLSDYSYKTAYLWLCFADEYSGYAVSKAREKWQMISDDTFPETVEEFMDAILLTPRKVLVDMNGRFPELISVICDESEEVKYEETEFTFEAENNTTYDDSDIPF